MRIVVIGATGHIGSYLVPRLVYAEHEVIALSRGQREPYLPDPVWDLVQQVRVDRDAEDAQGVFGRRIAEYEADAVVDLVCFTAESARQLAEALQGHAGLLLHCGTIWVHGPLTAVPATEDAPRVPFGDYGIAKDAIERYLLSQNHVPATVLHPGTSSGRGGRRAIRPATST